MTKGNSITPLGDFSESAKALIEKISDAVGGLCKPWQIKRVAQAEADAEIIKAKGQIEIDDLQRRALVRFMTEEGQKQANMEAITEKAIPQLEDSAKPEEIENDWVTNFFDKCRIVSNDEMQALWARVLAGEANSPGSYSKRTVNLLSSLDKSDAQLFTSLCGFCWLRGTVEPLIFDFQAFIYNNHGVNFKSLTHLDDIGLINFNILGGFNLMRLDKYMHFFYHDMVLNLEFEKPEDNKIAVGCVLFTKIGQQLRKICGAKPVPGCYDYTVQQLAKQKVILSSPYPKPSSVPQY